MAWVDTWVGVSPHSVGSMSLRSAYITESMCEHRNVCGGGTIVYRSHSRVIRRTSRAVRNYAVVGSQVDESMISCSWGDGGLGK